MVHMNHKLILGRVRSHWENLHSVIEGGHKGVFFMVTLAVRGPGPRGGGVRSSIIIFNFNFVFSVAARQRKAAHTGGPLPKLGRWPPAVKKAISPEQNHSARRKSQDFRPLVLWVLDPYPSDHFLASNVK